MVPQKRTLHCTAANVRFVRWIQRIDATPFDFKLARRNGMHPKGMQELGSRQSSRLSCGSAGRAANVGERRPSAQEREAMSKILALNGRIVPAPCHRAPAE